MMVAMSRKKRSASFEQDRGDLHKHDLENGHGGKDHRIADIRPVVGVVRLAKARMAGLPVAPLITPIAVSKGSRNTTRQTTRWLTSASVSVIRAL